MRSTVGQLYCTHISEFAAIIQIRSRSWQWPLETFVLHLDFGLWSEASTSVNIARSTRQRPASDSLVLLVKRYQREIRWRAYVQVITLLFEGKSMPTEISKAMTVLQATKMKQTKVAPLACIYKFGTFCVINQIYSTKYIAAH